MEQLESLQWIEEEQNTVVIGKCDTGKTTMAAHTGQLALNRREAVHYCNLEIENSALLRAEYMGQTRSQRFSGKSSFSVTFRLLGRGSQISRPILPDNGAELALEPENKAAMERIDEETIQLQEAALALHKVKQRMEIEAVEYASRVKEYSERMKELEAERNELQGTAAKYAEVRMWLDTFIEQTMQSDTLTTVDGTTMKMLVDRIHVRNDGIVVEFKCGVAIEQEYVK